MEKKELIEQELNKKYGAMSVKEFSDRFREIGEWLNGYLSMIYPSLDENIAGPIFSFILLSDLCYSMGPRERLSSLARKEQERIEKKMNLKSQVDTMLKDLGIRKENADDNAPFPNN